MSEFKGIHQDRIRSHSLVSKGKISRRELLKMVLPFGKLELVGSQCSGCGLCALECPTEALTTSSSREADAYQLLFQHNRCFACGRCVEVCPEQCLRLERNLELDKIDGQETVLFQDRMVRCRECGSIIGSRAMIDKLWFKVLAMGKPLASQLELCPMCKIKAQLSLGRATQEISDETD